MTGDGAKDAGFLFSEEPREDFVVFAAGFGVAPLAGVWLDAVVGLLVLGVWAVTGDFAGLVAVLLAAAVERGGRFDFDVVVFGTVRAAGLLGSVSLSLPAPAPLDAFVFSGDFEPPPVVDVPEAPSMSNRLGSAGALTEDSTFCACGCRRESVGLCSICVALEDSARTRFASGLAGAGAFSIVCPTALGFSDGTRGLVMSPRAPEARCASTSESLLSPR